MTIEGAIVELQNLIDSEEIPFWEKPSLRKVKETVEDEREVRIALQEKQIVWHPYPKEKPKVANWYLVTLDYEDMDNFVSKKFWDGKTDLIWDCCIAWAELPKPYEEGADNE